MRSPAASKSETGNKTTKGSRASHPDPFIVVAKRAQKQSLILLHGHGSNGEKFGLEFLKSHTSMTCGHDGVPMTMADHFPDMKFIFPTAKKRRAKWYNRATINQWFDSVPIDEQDGHGVTKEEEEWQLDGLRETRAAIRAIIDGEVANFGACNVFIGGLSQGCAMSLHVLLSHEGITDDAAPLGGFVGMSGWLPYATAIERILQGQPPDDENDEDDDDEDDVLGPSSDAEADEHDPFASGDDHDNHDIAPTTQTGNDSVPTRVCNFVRDNMDLPPLNTSDPLCLRTLVFLGHGKSDEKVKMIKGQKAVQCLRDMGVDVTWKDYDEGHWYKVPEEIDDIVEFLQTRLLDCSSSA
ncbi:uncharacterized protein CLAFUR5_10299 [Fulvia fulva]|uniref:Phospholipase/carboxylesterase/thioesterase domain-containing protein n=1 Tax=Passalora fulva TaxID=5499 RepID=A0A9Q8PD77_PASFU|nr:uncharacterized protein CLAFUR5_10299 [Fulvia fulva]UJO20285.1 hypothetical protein CLAFUR5_10299 [Fulvia fulva]